MKTAVIPALIAGLAAASPAMANWQGKVEAGIVFSRGNTETTTGNGKLDMANELDDWKHSAYLAALYAESENSLTNERESTAERYEARWQSDYRITPRAYWFGGLRYERDEFSGFDYQASLTSGFGYRFIDTKRTKFYGQAGLGYRQMQDRITREKEDELVYRGDLGFERELTANTKLTDKLIVEAGSTNTFAGNDLALEVKMSERFGLSVGYGVRYNSDPPPGLESTDTLMTVNLGYSF
ncbi:MAG: YdiY family protein [Steroidobacteraceae bacterium]